MRTTEKKIKKTLKGFKSDLREEERFEILAPIESHVKEDEKNVLKFQFSKCQKSQPYFCEDHWEENSDKVRSFRLRFVGGVAF